MKNLHPYAIVAAAAFALVQSVHADITLLSDSFGVDANVSNPNYEIANGRQTGTQATSQYTYSGNVQVGHTGADFGQPGGAANGNFMLLAQNAWTYNNLAFNDSLLNGGSLKISFGLYANYSGTSAGDWLSFTMGTESPTPWPTSNHFGLIVHHNGGLDVFDGSTDVFSKAAGYVTTNTWTIIFSAASGTGSPFDGTTRASIYNGSALIYQFNMTTPLQPGDLMGWYAYSSMIGGMGNLSVVATSPPPVPLTASPFSLGVPYGGAASQTVVGVYTPFVDTNGNPVFIAGVTQGTNGTVTFTSTNLTYTCTNNGPVADRFNYIMSDSLGEFATNTVTTYQLSPPVNIMPLGDSITWGNSKPSPVPGGYYYLLYQLLTNLNYNVHFVGTVNDNSPPGMTINTEGLQGTDLIGVDALLPGIFSEIDDPDVILLLLGTNDYTWNTPDGATNRLDQIITDLATRRPRAKILVSNLLLRTDNSTYWSQITNQFNPFVPGIVAAHAAQGQQVYFVNLNGGFNASGLCSDGLHPNAAGYGMMANTWLPAVTNVINPFGTTNAPAISHVTAQAGLTNLLITFSKPIGTSATNAANYTLSGGLTVTQASLDYATRRLVTLTTSPQTPNTAYTLTVNAVADFTPAATAIAPNSTATFQSSAAAGAMNNVPEAAQYTLAYSLNIPNAANYGSTNPLYSVDNHAGISRASRVAYYLELQSSNGPLQYLWVSMNPFTQNAARLGVPTLASGAVFQQNVTNMNVYSDVPGIVTGTGLTGGNIEFWPYNYVEANAAGVPNANPNVYDFGDQNLGSGNYGSMQIANHDAGQMLLCFNQWNGNNSANVDLGIGNNLVYYVNDFNRINALRDINTDWTFRGNGGDYVLKRLQVYVAVPNPVASPMAVAYYAGASVTIAWADLATNWSDVPGQSVSLNGLNLTSTNGVTVSTNVTGINYYSTSGLPDQVSYTIMDTAGVTATGVVNLTVLPGSLFGPILPSISAAGGAPLLNFGGIPGYSYSVQRSTNLSNWTTLWTTNAPAAGAFQFVDPTAPQPMGFYRLQYNP
jgi:lysophospholipase L1-like esterase